MCLFLWYNTTYTHPYRHATTMSGLRIPEYYSGIRHAGSPHGTAIGHPRPPVLPSTALHRKFFYQRPAALSPFAGRPIANYWPVAVVAAVTVSLSFLISQERTLEVWSHAVAVCRCTVPGGGWGSQQLPFKSEQSAAPWVQYSNLASLVLCFTAHLLSQC